VGIGESLQQFGGQGAFLGGIHLFYGLPDNEIITEFS
jgi:hypothetical protein